MYCLDWRSYKFKEQQDYHQIFSVLLCEYNEFSKHRL